MEPVSITIGTVVTGILIFLTAVGATMDIATSTALDEQAARYYRISDAYVRVLDDRHANGQINDRDYAIEMERARLIKQAYIDQADIVSNMANDRRVNAVSSVTKDVILSLNPGARAGRLIGPATQAGGQIVDIALSADSTVDTANNLLNNFNPGAPIDENMRDRVAAILGLSEDDLIQAMLGARLGRTRTQWLKLNEVYWDNPAALDKAFDKVLVDMVARVNEYDPLLVGEGRRFSNDEALKAYLRAEVENLLPPTGLIPADAFEEMPDNGDEPPPDDAVPDDAFEDTNDIIDEPPPDDAFVDDEAFGPLPLTPDLTYLMNDVFYADYTCQSSSEQGVIRLGWNGSNFTYSEPGAENVFEIPFEYMSSPDMSVEHDEFVFSSLIYRMGAPSLWLPLDGSVYNIPQEIKQDTPGHYVGFVKITTELRLQPSQDVQTILGKAIETTLYQGSYTEDFVNDDREGNAFATGYQHIVDVYSFRAWYDNRTGLIMKTHLHKDNTVCDEEGDHIGDCPKEDPVLDFQCKLTSTSMPITE